MSDYQSLYNQFTQSDKSLLIAPAGYGKTHTIAACLKHLYDANPKERVLILTHAHAGVASIKEKVKKTAPGINCQIETISSFAQKYVHAFYRNEIPEQDDKRYFPFLIKKAAILFQRRPITLVLKNSYTRLFVDEYQDCTVSQHEMILALAKLFPIHILGDPLQGIFSFNGEPLVDINTLSESFSLKNLTKPWRWYNTNKDLGDWLIKVRRNLENGGTVKLNELNEVSECYFFQVREDDFFLNSSLYKDNINKIVYSIKPFTNLGNTLMLVNQKAILERVKVNQSLGYKFRLLEANDEKDFYKYARDFDQILHSLEVFYNLMIAIKGVPKKVRTKNGRIQNRRSKALIANLGKYFKEDDRIPKPKTEPLKSIMPSIEKLVAKPKMGNLNECIELLSSLPDINFPRDELFSELRKAVKNAALKNTTVLEEMKELRNIKRRLGRNITGKCIGTTLLTKGLEFETVVVLDVHKFKDPKNLYVALTRASKRLIVFSERSEISF